MPYVWTQNILCTIRDGRAYLLREAGKSPPPCDGECHACSEFRSEDIEDTGKDLFRSSCGDYAGLQRAA